MRCRLVAALALATAATLLPSAHAQESGVAKRLAAVNALLDTRAQAERARDRDAFAKTIDPAAPDAFRAKQLASFDNLAALPLATIGYEANVETGGDLTRGASAAEYGGDRVFVPETIRRSRFAFDGERDWIDNMWWTYVERNGRWYVGGDDDLVDVGLETAVSMWDRGPVVLVQSPHVALIAHPQDRPRAEQIVALAEPALVTLNERWGLPWTGTLVGFLPESSDELTELIQASLDVTKFVAFVSYGVDTATYEPSAPRLYVQDENLRAYPAVAQTETLLHEFVHAAASRHASSFTPAWMHEGLADWVAVGPTNPFRRGSGSADAAPRDDQFAAGTQGQIIQAYRDARSLVAALARIAGPRAPYELFQALGAERVRAGSRGYVVDESLRRMGINGLADLEAKWREGR